MPTVTIFGSCRQDSIYSLYPVTSIKNSLTYPHYSSEILQAIKFCNGTLTPPTNITRFIFRSGILNKNTIYPDKFITEFNNSDLVIVEIASRIAYKYNGYYIHHILTDPTYGFHDIKNIEVYDLTDEEIEKDLIAIKQNIGSKKLIIVSHIYTRKYGKRYELVMLLKKLCEKYNIHFFDPIVQLGNIDTSKVFQSEEVLAHYTQLGHSLIREKYKLFIDNI